MAAVIPRYKIDDNDFEKYIPSFQTGAGITPINLRLDDGDVVSKIIAMQVAAGVSPVSVRIDRQDWGAKLHDVQTKLNTRAITSLSIANPAVVTLASHGWVAGQAFRFLAGADVLPTGVVANTTYYVISTGFTAGAFSFSASPGTNGTPVVTTGTQSGIHNVYPALG